MSSAVFTSNRLACLQCLQGLVKIEFFAHRSINPCNAPGYWKDIFSYNPFIRLILQLIHSQGIAVKIGNLNAVATNYKAHVIVVGIHVVVLILLYGQTQLFDYVQYDDADYVLNNFYVRSGLNFESIKWAFSSYYMSNWHPLTWMSHMLDVSLFGVDPGWAHIHNYILHGLNSLLLYVFFVRFSRNLWAAFIMSLIFLVHPLHVESVAWIAERKDLLCALFFLLGLILYDFYRVKATPLRYFGIVVVFSFALLSKPMAVTFPIILLILDVFVYANRLPNNSTGATLGPTFQFKYFTEKLPLFGLTAAMCIVTIIAQDRGGAIANIAVTPLVDRMQNAYFGYGVYLQQMILPTNLVPFYPLGESKSWSSLFLPNLLLIGWLVASLIKIRKHPLIGAGFCWYIVTLIPVIGIVQVGSQAHADRYMYLPSIGVLVAAIYLLPSQRNRHSALSKLVSISFIFYLSIISYWQISYWENQRTLYTHLLMVSGPSWRAHINLSGAYAHLEMWDEATQHGMAALALRDDLLQSYQALGDIALLQGKYKEAEEIYMDAVEKGYIDGGLLFNLGYVLEQQGKLTAALEVYEGARYLNPTLNLARVGIERLLLLQSDANK